MMRIVLISLAAAASALAVASPASAQYYPQPPRPAYGTQHYGGPGYGAPGYGMPGYGAPGYGYHGNFAHLRNLQVRINNLQRRIARLDNRNFLSEREARRLRSESRDIERRLRVAARYGLNPRENAVISNRIERLEARIIRDAHDRRRWARHGFDGDRWDRDDRRDDDRRWRDRD